MTDKKRPSEAESEFECFDRAFRKAVSASNTSVRKILEAEKRARNRKRTSKGGKK